MKTRYSFLTYIINMTCASTALSILVSIVLIILFGLASGTGLLGLIFGAFFAIFPAIFGLISGLISSLIVSLVAFAFFDPENISGQKFQIISFAIIPMVSTLLLFTLPSMLSTHEPMMPTESSFSVTDLGIILGIILLISGVITSAHYFASRHLVTTIEKRKSKNSQ